eukprot:jgi/Mesvir1/18350/Mv14247-RA.2
MTGPNGVELLDVFEKGGQLFDNRKQRFSVAILDLLKRRGYPLKEKDIRSFAGDNADVSKALRSLVSSRKIKRIGNGGKSSPFSYTLCHSKRDEQAVTGVDETTQLMGPGPIKRRCKRGPTASCDSSSANDASQSTSTIPPLEPKSPSCGAEDSGCCNIPSANVSWQAACDTIELHHPAPLSSTHRGPCLSLTASDPSTHIEEPGTPDCGEQLPTGRAAFSDPLAFCELRLAPSVLGEAPCRVGSHLERSRKRSISCAGLEGDSAAELSHTVSSFRVKKMQAWDKWQSLRASPAHGDY